MVSDLKRFDDYTDVVDCNDCSHYWDSSCDGVSKGSTSGCNSFLAKRSVVIPERLNKLERRLLWLSLLVFGEYAVGGIIVLVGWLLGKI